MKAQCVYVIGTPGSSTVKVGRTTDLPRRLADIQRMSPVPLQVLWTHPGGPDLETNLHRQFSALRSHGEWFTFGGDPVAAVRWAVEQQPWLRHKVSLKKARAKRGEANFKERATLKAEATKALRAPKVHIAEQRLTPEQQAAWRAKRDEAFACLFDTIEEIDNPSERYKAIEYAEGAFAKHFRQKWQEIAIGLKGQGRTWREVGELLGNVSAQRAHQIAQPPKSSAKRRVAKS
ncbi:GIY-YIG nuclease family protein [Streptomyces klenkii]|uniref:GIY-YIG nuclease family protein n=1 Tax=Streptomyces klenkii TaxID=1420899 RepID=UPI0036E90A14